MIDMGSVHCDIPFLIKVLGGMRRQRPKFYCSIGNFENTEKKVRGEI
jgi:hypothetical protein